MTDDERVLKSNIPPFGLRMQPDLKAKVEGAARKNNRSINAEITDRLEATFREEPGALAEAAAQIEAMRSSLVRQMNAYQKMMDQFSEELAESRTRRDKQTAERLAQLEKDTEERRVWQQEQLAQMNSRIEAARKEAHAERERYFSLISQVERRETELLKLLKSLSPPS